MADDDLGALIARVSLKDRQSFNLLYQKASPKLFAICLRILGDRGEAEDALQDIFVRIWQRAGTFASDGRSPSGWLATVARNHAIDRLRQKKPAARDIDAVHDLADGKESPEERAHLVGEGRRIDTCMERLKPEWASAVKEAYVSGLSYNELAERYGVPLNTMRTWLRRSLLKLKECLEA
ncbi:sigma-70 family RNA polymerase sigma factor [Martelella radicis]|uniref:RNA polymerase sigma-70 factor (ECF subfamily) n=1 Tax=Martelella radicis TaxID=1397476 RepID=A0A7W6KPZ7_9HYPH|nr:sigma-70 family RNA polymerase sigma factor [Martelella radicis]MBB4123950.1 RNA polymerase sigma-70 factor (ECF subfamily) [Martelella radicis]